MIPPGDDSEVLSKLGQTQWACPLRAECGRKRFLCFPVSIFQVASCEDEFAMLSYQKESSESSVVGQPICDRQA